MSPALKCFESCPRISLLQAQQLSNYPNVINNYYINDSNIGSISTIYKGNVTQNLQVIKELDPEIADLLSKLVVVTETRLQAEELVSDLAKYQNADKNMKEPIFKRVLEGVLKLAAIAEACENLKPVVSHLYQLLKPYAAAHNINLP